MSRINHSMEPEASSFETSEMLANLVASTPLLSESWRLINLANSIQNQSCFVTEQVGNVGFIAFKSLDMISEADHICYGNLVALDDAEADHNIHDHGDQNDHDHQLFSALHRQINEGEEPVMVHAGFLHLFFSIYACASFRNQMVDIMQKSKSIVIAGHSIRATTASLSTLWLLSYLQSISSSLSVLCITYGSPLLGNESLSRAILREKWDGNFCHVVSKHDIMPRLLFISPFDLNSRLQFLLKFWHLSMTSPQFQKLAPHSHNEAKSEIFRLVLAYLEVLAQPDQQAGSARSLFWPFGSYFFCSENGAICLDNAASVIKMMHLMLMTGSPCSSIEDHLNYGDYIGRVSLQFLKQRSLMQGDFPESCYEAGVALALQSSGLASQEPVAEPARDCLKMARRMGRTPNLNVANLAIKLSRITPYRAQIEWYKECCDDSDEQKGYYDSFKLRGATKRDSKVNMNRIMLGAFWDNVIEMLENNHLPHDFQTRNKWVNASQFYKLLVEPLDIAEYYRLHRSKGHYMKHGRARRYKIFDRWWKERRVSEEDQNSKRSRLASLTQDSCFWAKLEEAREWLENIKSESDARKLDLLWKNINNFDKYAMAMVESKQVSKDVLARNSSYISWVKELRELRS